MSELKFSELFRLSSIFDVPRPDRTPWGGEYQRENGYNLPIRPRYSGRWRLTARADTSLSREVFGDPAVYFITSSIDPMFYIGITQTPNVGDRIGRHIVKIRAMNVGQAVNHTRGWVEYAKSRQSRLDSPDDIADLHIAVAKISEPRRFEGTCRTYFVQRFKHVGCHILTTAAGGNEVAAVVEPTNLSKVCAWLSVTSTPIERSDTR